MKLRNGIIETLLQAITVVFGILSTIAASVWGATESMALGLGFVLFAFLTWIFGYLSGRTKDQKIKELEKSFSIAESVILELQKIADPRTLHSGALASDLVAAAFIASREMWETLNETEQRQKMLKVQVSLVDGNWGYCRLARDVEGELKQGLGEANVQRAVPPQLEVSKSGVSILSGINQIDFANEIAKQISISLNSIDLPSFVPVIIWNNSRKANYLNVCIWPYEYLMRSG